MDDLLENISLIRCVLDVVVAVDDDYDDDDVVNSSTRTP